MTALRVEKPGMLTTVQDGGRPGRQHIGVTVGGAMDLLSLRTANILVGNDRDTAALEVTLIGPVITFAADTLVALAGGDLDARIDSVPLPLHQPVVATAGSRVTFGARRRGCRAYLAVAGGIDVPVVLGGRGTDLAARFGGHEGRPLRAGDAPGLGAPSPLSIEIARSLRSSRPAEAFATPVDAAEDRGPIRLVPGPEYDLLAPESRDSMFAGEFTVTPDSNRMGYRLAGPRLRLERTLEMTSSPVALGTIQLPAGGEPIVLMADRQTTGGYPRIAAAITADIPRLAQLAPGDRLTFVETTIDAARQALREQEESLRLLERQVLAFAGSRRPRH